MQGELPVESVQVGQGAQTGAPKRYGGGEEMRRALQVYKDKFPQIDGILIGTRRTDPHGGGVVYPFVRLQFVDLLFQNICRFAIQRTQVGQTLCE